MKDVRKILNRIYETGRLPKLLPTPATVHAAWDARHYLDYTDSTTTIMQDVANFYKDAGYKVVSEGIGWRISE